MAVQFRVYRQVLTYTAKVPTALVGITMVQWWRTSVHKVQKMLTCTP